jgi:DNA-binding transcriptional regulator/RsmH inhibitor MraZ
MPGRSQPEAPWLLKVVKVDSRHRLFLPAGIADIVEWIGSGGTECRAYAAGGGVSLVPAARDELHGRLATSLSERRLTLDEVAVELGDVVRFAATSWPVSIDQQLRLTLPEDARKLRLLPGAGQRAAVFASGDVLEVWPADAWRRHVSALASGKPRFIADIEER